MDFDGLAHLSSDDEDLAALCISRYYESDESDTDEVAQNILGSGGSCDEFQKEMEEELNKAISNWHTGEGSGAVAEGANGKAGSSKKPLESSKKPSEQEASKKSSDRYDDVYFDSDEEDDSIQETKKRRSIKSDAELFYDPTADEDDEKWLHKHRYEGVNANAKQKSPRAEKKEEFSLPEDELPSDAVLNCPGCMGTLCVTCQRHSVYNNQYRAVFVIDCKVDYTNTLTVPTKETKKQMWKDKQKERKRNKKETLGDSQMEGLGTLFKQDENIMDEMDTHDDESKIIEKTEFSSSFHNKRKNEDKEDSLKNNQGILSPKKKVKFAEPSFISDEAETSSILDQQNSSVLCPKKTKFNIIENDLTAESKTQSSSSHDTFDNQSKTEKKNDKILASVLRNNGAPDDVFFSVSCMHCNTKVAVLDREEIYHFFNVITSY